MEARTYMISEVIQRDRLLRIPYFQRRYVWERKDWERFAMDMESTLDSESNYFLGALILKDETTSLQDRRNGVGRKQQVIDGQQRLTTLAIYMKVLHMMTNRKQDFDNQYLQGTQLREPVIAHGCEDAQDFRKIMHLETPQEHIEGAGNIIDAYNFFREYLEKAKSQISLEDLLNTVNSSVTFVGINLTREDNEQRIFDTINSLGVPLTTGELMKNFLYEAEDEDVYNRTWKLVFDTDEARTFWESGAAKSRQEKSKDNTIIERFFHAFVRIKMWDFKDQLTESQRKNFVKISNVFETCKAFVEKFGMNKQELAQEILTYAQLYREHLSEDILDTRIPKHGGIKRISCLINATQKYAVIPYVLYVLNTQKDELERTAIFDFLETYLMRRILADSESKSYSEMFPESFISNRLTTAASLKDFIMNKSPEVNLAMPANGTIKLKVKTRTKSIDERTARLVFYMYETKLTSASEGSFTGGYNDYVSETLMPKVTKADNPHWPKHRDNTHKEEERKQQIGTLGNMFLVKAEGKKELKKTSESDCPTKVVTLQKWSEGVRSNTILEHLTSWTKENIMSRNDGLADVMSRNIWTI